MRTLIKQSKIAKLLYEKSYRFYRKAAILILRVITGKE